MHQTTFHVRIAKEELIFSAAHFITFNGDVCERLHGHNYTVAAEVAGPLDENSYVVDFIYARDSLKQLVQQLDHHVLLPTTHPLIHVAREGDEVIARFQSRRWVFPVDDCVLLPVANTTAELLAQYLAERWLISLQADRGVAPSRLRVEIDECAGQIGVCDTHFRS